jgi:hypothetical protein
VDAAIGGPVDRGRGRITEAPSSEPTTARPVVLPKPDLQVRVTDAREPSSLGIVLKSVSLNLFLLALVLLLTGAAPSTAPSTQPSDPVAQWLKQLADDDPAVRDAAREQLMSLDRDGLRQLKRAVERNRPLAPAQALALRDIVTHVFLASLPYAQADRGAFVGVKMDPRSATDGIIVVARIPGFAAYRSLRDGDVIISIAEWPEPLDDTNKFGNRIANEYRGGDTVHLKVQRGGRVVTVPLTLSPRPANANNAENMRIEQMPAADEYWQQNFAPLLEPTASS